MISRSSRVRRTLGHLSLMARLVCLAAMTWPGCAAIWPGPQVGPPPGPDPAGAQAQAPVRSATPTRAPVAPDAARPNPTPIQVADASARAVPVGDVDARAVPAPQAAPSEPAASVVRCRVDEGGISNVELNNLTIASGRWGLIDAADYFPADPQAAAVGPVLKATVESLGEGSWRVTHQHRELRVVYDYVARGEDIVVRAEIANQSPQGRPIHHLAFSGLSVVFPQSPSDVRVSRRHPSYFKSRQWEIAHPSYYNPLGAWMLRGGAVNLGFIPLDAALQSKVLWGNYDTTGSKIWTLTYAIRQEIPAGQAGVVRMTMRFSANGDWAHLLAPYKAEFDRRFPQTFYTGDARPLAMCATTADKRITPANPLGFASDTTRFDLESGVKQFLTSVADPLQLAGAQGCIFWDMQGFNTRGAMYRPDFDIFPPTVKANVPMLIAGMKSRGLKVGMLARPADVVVPASPTQDTTRRVESTDAAAMEAMWNRFNTVIDWGVTDFYLDTFGNLPDDVNIMIQLRERMRGKGVNIQTFAEFGIDVMLPYSGYYTEVRYDEQKRSLDFGPYTNLEDVRIFRWLVPGVTVIAQVRVNQPPEAVWAFCMRERVLPLVAWWDVKAKSALLRATNERYVDPSTNGWR